MCLHRFSLNWRALCINLARVSFPIFFFWLSLRVTCHDESQVVLKFEGKTARNFVTLFALDVELAIWEAQCGCIASFQACLFNFLFCSVRQLFSWYYCGMEKKNDNVPVMPGKMPSALHFDFSWSNIVCTRLKQVWTDLKAWEKNSGVKGIQTHECRLGCMHLLKIKQLGAGKSW